jgi:predicted nucleotidyltransferase component of viral defense system
MLNRDELSQYSKVTGYSLGQTELDYMHHQVLSLLGRSTKNDWVFKGGTCLQKVLSLDRFSEDLDFTVLGQPDIERIIDKLVDDLDVLGMPGRVKRSRPSKKSSEGTFRVLLEGPLFDGKDLSRCSVLFNLSFREDLEHVPHTYRAVPRYPDLPPYLIYHMEPAEMLAEKVRALLTRNKARDLYDIGFLLQKGYSLDISLVNRKLSIYSMKVSKNMLKQAVFRKGPLWQKELILDALVPLIPKGK